jgi:predicted ThiF/HesA family dinucleotide-utilizing enzyme
VVEACYDQKIGLHIDEVEVNHPEFLVMYVPDGDKVKEVTLSWRDMGKRTAESRQDLLKKLGKTVESMQSEEGRQRLRFNATLDGMVYCAGVKAD